MTARENGVLLKAALISMGGGISSGKIDEVSPEEVALRSSHGLLAPSNRISSEVAKKSLGVLYDRSAKKIFKRMGTVYGNREDFF